MKHVRIFELAKEAGLDTYKQDVAIERFAQAVAAECVPNLAAECSKESERLRYCYERAMASLIVPMMTHEEWIIAIDAVIDCERSKP